MCLVFLNTTHTHWAPPMYFELEIKRLERDNACTLDCECLNFARRVFHHWSWKRLGCATALWPGKDQALFFESQVYMSSPTGSPVSKGGNRRVSLTLGTCGPGSCLLTCILLGKSIWGISISSWIRTCIVVSNTISLTPTIPLRTHWYHSLVRIHGTMEQIGDIPHVNDGNTVRYARILKYTDIAKRSRTL